MARLTVSGAVLGALALLATPACSGTTSTGAAGAAGDLGGTWSGAWTGPGSAERPPSVAVLEVTQGEGRARGGFQIRQGPPFYDVLVWVGAFDATVGERAISFSLEATVGSYRGTATVRQEGGRSYLDLEYEGVSCCGFPHSGHDTLVRLDTCPASRTVCPGTAPACADLRADDTNCGDCGVACSAPMYCRSGECSMPQTPACTAPLALQPAVPVVGFPASPPAPEATPREIVLADLDGDGRPDGVVAFDDGAYSAPDVVSIMLNDGSGTFAPGGTYLLGNGALGRSGTTYPIALAVGDFDGDGVADLAALHMVFGAPTVTGISLFRGQGDGAFGAATELPVASGAFPSFLFPPIWRDALATADLDGDGRSDLVVLDPVDERVVVFRAAQDGFAAAASYAAPGVSEGVVVADLDLDGALDVAVGFVAPLAPGSIQPPYRSGILVLRGNGDGTLGDAVEEGTLSSAIAGPLVAGDFEADGYPDVLQLGVGTRLYAGRSGGTFAVTELSFPWRVDAAVGDFDGDGLADVVVPVPDTYRVTSTRIWFYGGVGDGSFRAPVAYDLDALYRGRIAAGDLDGDGTLDLALLDPEVPVAVMLGCSR